MSFVNETGERDNPVGTLDIKEENIERLRDLIIVKLKAMRIPERTIGKILRRTQPWVNKRYREMHPGAREYYGRKTLG